MTVKNPREANGPSGYPIDNPAFRKAVEKVVRERQPDAERAKAFREKLREDLRRKSG